MGLTSAIGWVEDHNGIGLSVDYNILYNKRIQLSL